MDFSKPEPSSVLEMLAAWWPWLLVYAIVLGIGMVRMARRPVAPTVSLSRRRGRHASTLDEEA